jgi:hypothetical protein
MHFGLLSFGFGLLGLSLVACSSNVTTVFGEGGAGGDGEGASGATGPGSGPTSGTGQTGTSGPGATSGPGSSVSGTSNVSGSTTSSNPTTSSVSVVSGSTSSGMTCDMGSCDTCVECSINTTCSGAYNACFNNPECSAFVMCVEGCQNQGNPDACYQQCFEEYPAGAQLYQEAVFCVICNDCYQSCDGQSAGC